MTPRLHQAHCGAVGSGWVPCSSVNWTAKLSSAASTPKGRMEWALQCRQATERTHGLVTLGTVEHKAKAAQVSRATPWGLNPESCESRELPLRLPDASRCHLHSKPRADGHRAKKKKKRGGERTGGRDRRPPSLRPQVSRTPLTQVGSPNSLGPGSQQMITISIPSPAPDHKAPTVVRSRRP